MNTIKGVMLNAYPDSMGGNLSAALSILKMPEFENAFSLFYILPTFFNTDLDRGFSVIDYNLNNSLVNAKDLEELKKLNIKLKLDIVLNHLSVASPQFKDLLKNGNESKYKDFFINWNDFWGENGSLNEEGIVIPNKNFLEKLFMRKSGLPILKLAFPNGKEEPYWNTFYQKIIFNNISHEQVKAELNVDTQTAKEIANRINENIEKNKDLNALNFQQYNEYKEKIIALVQKNKTYLGQMDVNAQSPLVWQFYEETLSKLAAYGCTVLRLDAFAYLHKQVGETNFFNKPGTWQYLQRINLIAQKNGLKVLPEIHSEYGAHLHDEVANEGYIFYDFFMPGLLLYTIEKQDSRILINWAKEIIAKKFNTVNMLGCHDGIPLLDLKGKEVNGVYNKGLLTDDEIEDLMNIVLQRGGRVKNLYGADGKKISYYQINATYYSALGESDKKLLLARAIQLFMPGIPQVWYLDLFAGKNDYEAVEREGPDGHKEINRTNLTLAYIQQKLKEPIVLNQLKLIQLRNNADAFNGQIVFEESQYNSLKIKWVNKENEISLSANLVTYAFTVTQIKNGVVEQIQFNE